MRREFTLPLIAVVAFCCGIVATVTFQGHSKSTSAKKALSMSQKAADANDLETAYDLWLIAANSDPASPDLLKTAEVILHKSKERSSQVAEAVAGSLKERLPLLLPFQNPESVVEFRSAIQPLLGGEPESAEPASLESRLNLVSNEPDSEVAKTKSQRLRDEVENLLADTEPSEEEGRKHLRQVLTTLDTIELGILLDGFKSTLPDIKAWHEMRINMETVAAAGLFTKTGELSTPMTKHVQKGLAISERLATFSASGLTDAGPVYATLTKSCERLSRAAEWVYNQEALKVLHQVRDNSPADATFRANKLVTVDAARLNNVVMGRYNREYHFLFHELLKEDESRALDLMKQMTLEVLKLP